LTQVIWYFTPAEFIKTFAFIPQKISIAKYLNIKLSRCKSSLAQLFFFLRAWLSWCGSHVRSGPVWASTGLPAYWHAALCGASLTTTMAPVSLSVGLAS